MYRFLWPLRLVWLLVCCLYKEVYLHFFKRVSFWLHGCCGNGKVGSVTQVNHTSWAAVVTPTDRPKSVRHRCVIELFCGVLCVVTLPFWYFCWCRGFCHRTESTLFLVLLSLNTLTLVITQIQQEITLLWLLIFPICIAYDNTFHMVP